MPAQVPVKANRVLGVVTSLGEYGSGDFVPIANGGTGATSAQLALNVLSGVAGATNEYVLTKDTATGNAIFKAATGGGGASGDFIQAGTGAVTRTMQNKVRESISVKDFGATGDGTTDDTAACQLALDSVALTGGSVYFPSGAYKITGANGLNLPQHMITVHGDGPSTRLFSTGTIFTYPLGMYIPGYVALQNIEDMLIEQTGNGTSVVMTQTWDALGKPGPSIRNVVFFNSSPATTTAIGVRMQGVWSAKITDCWFIGMGTGGGPTTGIGGYGIRMVPGIGTSTNIMNTIIANNTFITVAFPVYMDMRNPTTGGVIEGIKITGNNMAAGWQGITTNWSLATSICGNQVSDYQTGIKSTSDFEMAITGNSEIHCTLSGINLTSGAVGYGNTERITISGNNIGGQGTFAGGAGVRLSNVTTDDSLRSIVISDNSFRGNPGSMATGYGIAFEGSKTINSVAMVSNSFGYLLSGFWFSGVAHSGNALGLNTFSNCAAEFTNFSNSGSNGNPLLAVTYPKAMIQAGSDLTSAAPTIVFPTPFKTGTTPGVWFTITGTANTTMEAPAISALSNTSFQVQKKQYNGAGIVLTNYQIIWLAVGEAP